MELRCKPNLADAIEHWRAFWNQDLIKRPCCAVTAPSDPDWPITVTVSPTLMSAAVIVVLFT